MPRRSRFDVGIELVSNADKELCLPNVVSSDNVILNVCPGWINLNARTVPGIPGVWIVDLSKKSNGLL